MTVLISGAGLAGLSLGLSLHQVGIPFQIFEQIPEVKPLGVGINLQPNAVRELYDLGLRDDLDDLAVRTQDYIFFSKLGRQIWAEKRGLDAGYAWPQYSIHRGKLQMRLYETLIRRAGRDCVVTGAKVSGYTQNEDGIRLHYNDTFTEGDVLIACDGIHSAIRAQMYPDEGRALWNGQVLWRGTTMAPPYLSGAAMTMAGHDSHRFVSYPISYADPETGLAQINWIAELTKDPSLGWRKEDYNREADRADFAPLFDDWTFDWIDIPALIRDADAIYEFPLVDRDPVDNWTDGRATLIGDAAHATYPVGSAGASQAIVDARILACRLAQTGVNSAALHAYEDEVRPVANKIILANRGSGPDAIMQMVEDVCGGDFEQITDVMPYAALAAHAAKYKALAGFSIEELNKRPPLIPEALRKVRYGG